MHAINTKFIKSCTTLGVVALALALVALDSSNSLDPSHPYYMKTNVEAMFVFNIAIWVSIGSFTLSVLDYVVQSYHNNTK